MNLLPPNDDSPTTTWRPLWRPGANIDTKPVESVRVVITPPGGDAPVIDVDMAGYWRDQDAPADAMPHAAGATALFVAETRDGQGPVVGARLFNAPAGMEGLFAQWQGDLDDAQASGAAPYRVDLHVVWRPHRDQQPEVLLLTHCVEIATDYQPHHATGRPRCAVLMFAYPAPAGTAPVLPYPQVTPAVRTTVELLPQEELEAQGWLVQPGSARVRLTGALHSPDEAEQLGRLYLSAAYWARHSGGTVQP